MSSEEDAKRQESRCQAEGWDGCVGRKLMQALEGRGVSFEQVAAQLSRHSDRPLTAEELKEQLHKGEISAGLLLQIIDSLSDKRLSLKDLYDMEIVEEDERDERDENINRRG